MSVIGLAEHEVAVLKAYRRLRAECPRNYRAQAAKQVVEILGQAAHRMFLCERRARYAEKVLADENGRRTAALNKVWAVAIVNSDVNSGASSVVNSNAH